MSEQNELLVDIKGAVCTVTINRPHKRNALSPQLLKAMISEIDRLHEEDNIRCLILRGAGEKAFSSGYDISALGQHEGEMMRDYRDDHPLVNANKAVENFPYPVIAMLNGHAFGGGLELALSCDIRICSNKALLAMPPAKLGVIYTYTGIRKFLNLIGVGYTKELFLVGRTIDAQKADKIGLVNYVLPPEELEEFTYAMADEIVSNAPLSMKTMKHMINAWQKNQVMSEQEVELSKTLITQVQASDDILEGQKAFAEKRKPVFQGS